MVMERFPKIPVHQIFSGKCSPNLLWKIREILPEFFERFIEFNLTLVWSYVLGLPTVRPWVWSYVLGLPTVSWSIAKKTLSIDKYLKLSKMSLRGIFFLNGQAIQPNLVKKIQRIIFWPNGILRLKINWLCSSLLSDLLFLTANIRRTK